MNDNAEIFSDGQSICWKRDEDRTNSNEGVNNGQADRDKAIAGKATIMNCWKTWSCPSVSVSGEWISLLYKTWSAHDLS